MIKDIEIYPGATARALPNVKAYKVLLQANENNSHSVRIGTRSSQSVRLAAGQGYTITDILNLNQIYVRAENSTDKLAIHVQGVDED